MGLAAIAALLACPAACALAMAAAARRRRRARRTPTPGPGSGPGGQPDGDREPRNPLVPAASGAAALPLPGEEESAPWPR